MPESILSKPFSEGAPLDPNALNDLRTDILNTYKTTNSLYSQTVSGQNQNYKFYFNCGSIGPVSISKGKNQPITVDVGNGFEVTQPIIVTATIGYASGAPADGDIITPVIISNNGQSHQLYIVSNVSKSVTVFWTAIQKIQTT